MDNTTKTYRVLIVDDDEIDRLTVMSFCRRYPFLQVIAAAESAEAAVNYMQKETPDVLLLDIDMPGMSGIELRKQAVEIPVCIFITSHPEFAVESFELAALDYLLKPIKSERFDAAILRLQQYMTLRQKAQLLDYTVGGETIFIKEGTTQVKIALHEVMYLEALKDYTSIVTGQRKYCILSPLSNLLEQASFKNFIRIHRSYAVQKHYVTRLSSKELYISNIILPVGRTYKYEVEAQFS
jgi:two-component system, LytTR family, response regulator